MTAPFRVWPAFDGLMTTSMWAQWFAEIPVVSAYQHPPWPGEDPPPPGDYGPTARRYPVRNLSGPVFCPPGTIPQPTGVPGRSRCLPYSAPSTMIGPQPQVTVTTMVPPAWPTARTFPVGPYWGWKEGI